MPGYTSPNAQCAPKTSAVTDADTTSNSPPSPSSAKTGRSLYDGPTTIWSLLQDTATRERVAADVHGLMRVLVWNDEHPSNREQEPEPLSSHADREEVRSDIRRAQEELAPWCVRRESVVKKLVVDLERFARSIRDLETSLFDRRFQQLASLIPKTVWYRVIADIDNRMRYGRARTRGLPQTGKLPPLQSNKDERMQFRLGLQRIREQLRPDIRKGDKKALRSLTIFEALDELTVGLQVRIDDDLEWRGRERQRRQEWKIETRNSPMPMVEQGDDGKIRLTERGVAQYEQRRVGPEVPFEVVCGHVECFQIRLELLRTPLNARGLAVDRKCYWTASGD